MSLSLETQYRFYSIYSLRMRLRLIMRNSISIQYNLLIRTANETDDKKLIIDSIDFTH